VTGEDLPLGDAAALKWHRACLEETCTVVLTPKTTTKEFIFD
jgi:hypothetical protein